jgi:hypothetical protein
MMHFAYPIVHQGQFAGCVRYLSLPPHQAPGTPYKLAYPRTPHLQAVHAAVQNLVPKRVEQLAQGTLGQVYERADQPVPSQGASLDLAYFLALIWCSRRLVLEACADFGDVWCTGELEVQGNTRSLKFVDQWGFDTKLTGFLAQAHDGDHLFFVPAANVDTQSQLKGPGARQAFSLLGNLAPYLEPQSNNIQFDKEWKYRSRNSSGTSPPTSRPHQTFWPRSMAVRTGSMS